MLGLSILINSLNNTILLKKKKVQITKFNFLLLKILELLQKINIIDSFLIDKKFSICTIYLNPYLNNVTKILCISKPTKYIYYTITDLLNLRSLDLYNDYIISISNNMNSIVTIDDAIKLNKGGLLLLKIIKTN